MHDDTSSPGSPHEVRAAVRERYGAIPASTSGCCAPATGCCGASAAPEDTARALGYADADVAAAPAGSNLGLGCGNPLAIRSLKPGERVLDLGSGAGFDAFLAARAVGPSGHVIGVDMTPEMLAAARRHLAASGLANAEFRLGEIEHLPIADGTIDVVLSNCVVNLSPEKSQVFREAFRVLRPGGRLAISDIVAFEPLPERVRDDLALHVGCVAGAATIGELEQMLADAGFVDVAVVPKQELQSAVDGWFPDRGIAGLVTSATITARKP